MQRTEHHRHQHGQGGPARQDRQPVWDAASAEELGTFEAMGSQATFDRVLYDGGEFGHSGEVHVGSEEEMDFLGIPGLLEPDQVRDLLQVKDTTVVEADSGTSTAKVKVVLSQRAHKKVSVSYTTRDGTATAGSDYVAKTGRIYVEAGLPLSYLWRDATPSTLPAMANLADRLAGDHTLLDQ